MLPSNIGDVKCEQNIFQILLVKLIATWKLWSQENNTILEAIFQDVTSAEQQNHYTEHWLMRKNKRIVKQQIQWKQTINK